MCLNVPVLERDHGQRLVRGEPVGLVVPGRVVADVVKVTKEEGHGVELGDTGSRGPQILVVGLLVPLQVQQAEPVPQFVHPVRTFGRLVGLRVLDDEDASQELPACRTRCALKSHLLQHKSKSVCTRFKNRG